MIRTGRLRAVRIGRRVYVTPDLLEECIARHTVGTGEAAVVIRESPVSQKAQERAVEKMITKERGRWSVDDEHLAIHQEREMGSVHRSSNGSARLGLSRGLGQHWR